MGFFRVFLFAILLLLQAYAEAASTSRVANSLANTYEGSQQAVAMNEHVQLHKINCNHECSRRCKKAFKKKRCKRACKSCCNTCHCVPPGTYGHKEVCPCYATLKTHGNKPKCP
ncbi:peamaclein-like [Abrus precatorius]|uniref:Peamaclein-like n=1 Tax=Abrus precatorius TaxID=3816 RepID=A0A8B8MIM8_ABRPR|nr:peamaclein-like [Abrus precatorius]